MVQEEVAKQIKTSAANQSASRKSKSFKLPISSPDELEDFHDKLQEQADFRTDFVSFTTCIIICLKIM